MSSYSIPVTLLTQKSQLQILYFLISLFDKKRVTYSEGPHFPATNFANSATQLVKFREIPRHYYPQISYIPRPVGVIVLTDNTSKYKEYIVTCNTKTHYMGH